MKKIISIAILSAILIPAFAFAQPQDRNLPPATQDRNNAGQTVATMSTLTNPLKVKSLQDLYGALFKLIVQIGYVVVGLFLILSGFKFVTAQGNESALEDAKHTFYYTIIGAFIVIGAHTIYAVLSGVLKSLNITS